MPMGDLLPKVKAFVAQFTGVSETELLPDTAVNRDLGVDGEDAVELMSAFAQEFQVDLTSFVFERHFGPEGWYPFGWLFKKEKIPITLRQLVEAANARRWMG